MTMRRSIGRENAIKMFQREWWVGKSYRDVALVGLSLQELTLPLTILHLAVENTLAKPIAVSFVKEEPEKLLRRILGKMPPLTLAQIHDIAFPGKERDLV